MRNQRLVNGNTSQETSTLLRRKRHQNDCSRYPCRIANPIVDQRDEYHVKRNFFMLFTIVSLYVQRLRG